MLKHSLSKEDLVQNSKDQFLKINQDTIFLVFLIVQSMAKYLAFYLQKHT